MLTAIELRQEAGKFLEQAKALADAAEIRGDGLTDEEVTKSEKLIESHDSNLKRAELLERREEREKAALGNEPGPVAPMQITQPKEEKSLYPLGEFMQAVAINCGKTSLRGRVPQRVERRAAAMIEGRATGLSEGIAADGGFLVGTDMASGLLKNAYDTGLLASRCRQIPISSGSNGVKMNGLDETSRADGSRGAGIVAYWKAEAAQKTATKPKFRQVELDLKKLIGLMWATDELLQDAAALGAVASQGFGDEFGFKIDDALIKGLGAGMPLGILVSGALVTVAKEAAQPNTTIVSQNVMKMYSRMFPSSIANSVFHINQDCWPQIFQMSLAVGTGGAPVFVPPGGLSQAPFGTLFGRPIVPLEQNATLGAVGDIILADWSHYLLATKGGIDSASSIHLKFDYDETVFRWVLRIDGQPDMAAPMTPYTGGANTLSAFVTLAGRP